MTAITEQRSFTPEDLLALPDSVNYELVDGHLVERNMGFVSSDVAAQILMLIRLFVMDHRLGRVLGADASYQCFADFPGKIRKPDVSFVRAGRFPGDLRPEGHCPIPPDLAVEVMSPGDLAYEIEEKVAEYIRAGIPLVWVVYPPTRTVRVHRPASSPLGVVSELGEKDTISG